MVRVVLLFSALDAVVPEASLVEREAAPWDGIDLRKAPTQRFHQIHDLWRLPFDLWLGHGKIFDLGFDQLP